MLLIYLDSTNREKNIVVILHIYGDIDISTMLYDDQDTLST